MLSNDELWVLFQAAESDRVERKESAGDRDKIRQAICAFANDLPNHGRAGIVVVGQRDDGSCANLPINDELITLLAGFRSDGKLLPFPAMYVRRVTLDGCEVAMVEVEPSDNP